jgi:drug/metabolite transporter (DMT)-like permease
VSPPVSGLERRDHVDLRAVLIVVLLCAIWGVQQVTIKLAIQGGFPPLMQAGLRSAGSAVLVVLWMLRNPRRGSRLLLARDGTFWPGMLIALLFAAEFLFLYPGLARTSASRGVLFLYTSPFFVAIGAHLFIPSERMGMRQTVGLLCAFAGIGVAVMDGLAGHGRAGTLLGDALVTAGAAIWGATTVLIKADPRLQRTPAAKTLLYQLAGSAPMLIVLSFLFGEGFAWSRVTGLALLCLVYQVVVVAFASYLTWFWLIVTYPASRIAAFSFLTPIFGMMAGAVMLHEPVSALLILALLLVIAGLRLVNSGRSGRPPAASLAPPLRPALGRGGGADADTP